MRNVKPAQRRAVNRSDIKIVILSDIHGNFDALSALPESYDELWVLGDLVNYGPQPAEVIDFVRSHATHVVRGNHDHCVGFSEDPRCSIEFRAMAEATRRYTEDRLDENDKAYLRHLPLHVDVSVGKSHFKLCHAVPSDPLFAYCPPQSRRWEEECRDIDTDVLLVGHTHLQFGRKIGDTLIVNPGSLGQPRADRPKACYAVLSNGKVSLRSFAYPFDKTIQKIQSMPIPAGIRSDLITVLRTASLTTERHESAYEPRLQQLVHLKP